MKSVSGHPDCVRPKVNLSCEKCLLSSRGEEHRTRYRTDKGILDWKKSSYNYGQPFFGGDLGNMTEKKRGKGHWTQQKSMTTFTTPQYDMALAADTISLFYRRFCTASFIHAGLLVLTSCACAYCAPQSVHSKSRPSHRIADRQLSEKQGVIRILAPLTPAIYA